MEAAGKSKIVHRYTVDCIILIALQVHSAVCFVVLFSS